MLRTLSDTGIIFDIKKYAIHDGPGIRTTVFLKGCPLRCRWCHNPESWSAEPELMVSRSRCMRCGACVEACPDGAVTLDDEGFPLTDAALCRMSGDCISVCPTQARKLAGYRIGLDALVQEVLKDSVFYDESGGGVTFSGGEPLMQPAFLKHALVRFTQIGVHTAVDTSLYAERSVLESMLPFCALFLCDIKHMDPDKHEEWTGVGNERILNNLRFLAEAGAEMAVRIPVVPGFNDTAEDIRRIAEFVTTLRTVRQVNLLAYNSGGVSKGQRLVKSKTILRAPSPDTDTMQELETIVEQYGFQVKEG